MANFAQRLSELRTARKLTQTRLAELLAVSPRVYSRRETGDETPHFDTIVRLADTRGVSLDDLAGRKDAAVKRRSKTRNCAFFTGRLINSPIRIKRRWWWCSTAW